MPPAEWEDWQQVAETFVAERPVARPDRVIDALLACLDQPLGELVAGNEMFLVGTKVYVAQVPGYRDRRALHLMDRFVEWLHERGVITTWQRDVLWTRIDEAREDCGALPVRARRVREVELRWDLTRVVERFADTLGGDRERALATAVLGDLERSIAAQLGSRGSAPAGMLDVDRLLRAWVGFELERDAPGLCAEAFAMLSRFYRWLADTEQLEPERARLIASQLSAAALGLQPGPSTG